MILNNTDYSWLPHSLVKGVKLPKIIYDEGHLKYGGYYDTETSIICINIIEQELVPATLAHEFCHHLQNQKSKPLVITRMDYSLTYEESIKKYFTSSWSEMEALRFEYKYAKSWLNDWWLRELVGVV